MKQILLSFILIYCGIAIQAQDSMANSLPVGKYETVLIKNKLKWERGDIIILDAYQYKISSSDEIGEYRFSVTAQRVFFTSGPLKKVYAKTTVNNNNPAIVLPVSENQQADLKFQSDIWCYLKD